ncbi:MAG: FAD-linked oxidase C-terminal domain-containing protein [Methanothrix sp.]|uniref:FAD-binding oxidoreductase n=1 Tax=Methanothrix sp. TaxID=90426 RepID=UPI003BB7F280
MLESLQEIAGDRVSSSLSERCCYSSDASQVSGRPDFVVRPANTGEISRILLLCNERNVPVVARGAGSGLAGGASPVSGGVVLDMSGMNRILEMDLENLQVIVEPGVVAEKLNCALKPHGFFFPPDPGSSGFCTIGGMISYNSSGMRSVKYGTTRSYVLDLEVVLADGKVIHTGSRNLKSAAGYDLTRLFVGSEGTLGIITRAGLKVAPLPKERRLVLASFESAEAAGQAVIAVFSQGITPSACEILDRTTLKVLRLVDPELALPDDGDVILFEVDGSRDSTAEAAEQIEKVCRPMAITIRQASGREMEPIWMARRLVGAAISRLDPKKTRIYMGEDVGVPIKQIPALIKKVQQITASVGIPAMKYGHIGDGNLHVALFIDVNDPDQWDRLRMAADRIHRAALSLGGTVSSEHGIGLARAEYMAEQVGEESLNVMRAIKKSLDPRGILNPGKMGL